MMLSQIREILHLGESKNVEFISSSKSIKEIGPMICGFLNFSGGYIIYGVDNEGKIIGIRESDPSIVKKFKNNISELISPKAVIFLQIQSLDGKKILKIEVPSGLDKPYAFENVIYLRHKQKTEKATIAEIREIISLNQIEPERWERRFSTADIEKDLNINEIRATVKSATNKGELTFNDPNNQVTILEDLSVSKYGRLTNAGDVLFGANPALRHPQIRVRAAYFAANKTINKVEDMKSFEGPLVPLLEEVYGFILRNTPTTLHFSPNSLERQNKPLYPPEAIREGLINAFAHRDYSEFSGGISVHIYPNRLEIRNTGKFLQGVTLGKLKIGHISVLRNPDIAHVLYLRNFMEKVGRGSLLIQEYCSDYNLPAPQWSQDDIGVTLTFFAPTHQKAKTRKPAALVSRTQEGTQEGTLERGTKVVDAFASGTPDVPQKFIRLLEILLTNELSRRDIQKRLSLKDAENIRTSYLKPALQKKLIELTIPDKPHSENQKYRITTHGRDVLKRNRL